METLYLLTLELAKYKDGDLKHFHYCSNISKHLVMMQVSDIAPTNIHDAFHRKNIR